MIIYKITNLINDKIYIGLTTQKINRRWTQHKSKSKTNITTEPFLNAIRKYGEENFLVEVIDKANNLKELNKKEKYWINYYNSNNNKIGYNVLSGGKFCSFNENTKKRMSMAHKGKKLSEEHKKNISKALKGKKKPEGFSDKVRERMLGTTFSEERKKNLSEAHKGHVHSEETKKKMSKKRKGIFFKEIKKDELLNLLKQDKDLNEIASIFNVSDVTIRNRIKVYFNNKTFNEIKAELS